MISDDDAYRGRCPVCHKWPLIRPDGTMRTHRQRDPEIAWNSLKNNCPGSGKRPAPGSITKVGSA